MKTFLLTFVGLLAAALSAPVAKLDASEERKSEPLSYDEFSLYIENAVPEDEEFREFENEEFPELEEIEYEDYEPEEDGYFEDRDPNFLELEEYDSSEIGENTEIFDEPEENASDAIKIFAGGASEPAVDALNEIEEVPEDVSDELRSLDYTNTEEKKEGPPNVPASVFAEISSNEEFLNVAAPGPATDLSEGDIPESAKEVSDAATSKPANEISYTDFAAKEASKSDALQPPLEFSSVPEPFREVSDAAGSKPSKKDLDTAAPKPVFEASYPALVDTVKEVSEDTTAKSANKVSGDDTPSNAKEISDAPAPEPVKKDSDSATTGQVKKNSDEPASLVDAVKDIHEGKVEVEAPFEVVPDGVEKKPGDFVKGLEDAWVGIDYPNHMEDVVEKFEEGPKKFEDVSKRFEYVSDEIEDVPERFEYVSEIFEDDPKEFSYDTEGFIEVPEEEFATI